MVNGLEWNTWKYYMPDGSLKEQVDLKAGLRDGHAIQYYENGQVRNDGWFKRGAQDSLTTSYYKSGRLMEQGSYTKGRKQGPWTYWYADGDTLMKELWSDLPGSDPLISFPILTDAWDTSGVKTIARGEGSCAATTPAAR
jgi:antitoxin component YwqK of YwqJK toxin-antitoxin module